ncbi:hypothetical protein H7K24_14695 [Mycobacterium fragae]|jgi:hypothetical protein|uniref:Glycosyltransferase n=1 Tax=Mycobacterium fragae TaxID=1260918 RepID=A0A1X1UIQ7_9MYCO|nr:hypothetical protein [Mycobacterium fragae]MCV7401398.1 hypothetical protein [Mycobacterium fragae]ORV56702.1 hypothetical protein AWC06_00235 [Mycobacterium fragae]
MTEPNANAPTVFVATPMYGGMATGPYVWSLAQTPVALMKNGIGVLYAYTMNDSLVAHARNGLVHQFLGSSATHLMFIDADIGFSPMDIVSMVRADKDIVCGMYPKKEINWQRVSEAAKQGVPPEELHKYVASFALDPLDRSAPVHPDQLLEVAGAGAGFMLVKRGVFEKLSEQVPAYTEDERTISEFYATGIDPESGRLLAEDYHFCRLARSHGFRVYAAPWARLSHTGTYMFGGAIN